MGKGKSSSASTQAMLRQQQESTASSLAAAQADVTPAIAKTIERDADSAQAMQLADRQRMRGISSTYLRGVATSSGGKTKLGQ